MADALTPAEETPHDEAANTPSADAQHAETPSDEAPKPEAARHVPRVLDLSTPRPPGEAPPEPSAEPTAPVPRGPAPVAGKTLDLSTGRAPSRPPKPQTPSVGPSAIVVRETINLSTKKAVPPAENAPSAKETGGRRGAPQGERSNPGGRSGGGRSDGGARRDDSRRGNSGRGDSRGGGSNRGQGGGGSRQPETPKPSSGTGLADFLDPETLKKLRGE